MIWSYDYRKIPPRTINNIYTHVPLQTPTTTIKKKHLQSWTIQSLLLYPFVDITRFNLSSESKSAIKEGRSEERCQHHQATITNSDTHKLHPKFFTFAIFHGNVLKRNSLSFVVLLVESLTPNAMLALIAIKPSLNS